jgi:hypothetical protein
MYEGGAHIFGLIAWGLGGIITGLILKGSISKFKSGQVFTVMFAWIISAIAAILVIAILADPFEDIAMSGWVFGLVVGFFGGWLTVRQISKAQKKG